MQILLYKWESVCEDDILKVMREMNIQVDTFDIDINNHSYDEVFIRDMEKLLNNNVYDYVFSFNYFPLISEICEKKSIPYISYIFDSPLMTLFSNTVFNKCNYIFAFDRAIVNVLKANGVENIFFMSLAVDAKKIENILAVKKEYQSDVSFLGSLYLKGNFFDRINYLPDFLKGYMSGIMEAQKHIYGYNMMPELIGDDIMKELKKYVKFGLGDNYWASDEIVFNALFLSRKLTSMERIEISDHLAQTFDFRLYTGDSTEKYPDIINKGTVDYNTQMPNVFYNSKINLNISLRSIETGIPLRIFDIMASRGFVITNYQADMLEFFEPDKDFVYYESIEDMDDKIRFYLKNDILREKIISNAYTKVLNEHTYEQRVRKMLELVK